MEDFKDVEDLDDDIMMIGRTPVMIGNPYNNYFPRGRTKSKNIEYFIILPLIKILPCSKQKNLFLIVMVLLLDYHQMI